MLLVSIGLVGGCLHWEAPPKPPTVDSPVQLKPIMPPIPAMPSRVHPAAEDVLIVDASAAATDTPIKPQITLSWDLQGSDGWSFNVYHSPLVTTPLSEWSVITNVAWPTASVKLEPLEGFFYIKSVNNLGFESR